jgi:hypothetical protein
MEAVEKENKSKGVLADIFRSILKGELLVRLHADKALPEILYLFVLVWLSIFLNIKIEKTMAEVETNKERLQETEIHHAQKTVEFVSLGRLSTVKGLLEEKGSDVGIPNKPADVIK